MGNNTEIKTNTGTTEVVKQTAKVHPLGKLVTIKAYALSPTEKKSQIFASINQYNVEFQQNTEVKVREAFVKFLQSATKISHVLEDGKPVSKDEPLYAVTVL